MICIGQVRLRGSTPNAVWRVDPKIVCGKYLYRSSPNSRALTVELADNCKNNRSSTERENDSYRSGTKEYIGQAPTLGRQNPN